MIDTDMKCQMQLANGQNGIKIIHTTTPTTIKNYTQYHIDK